MEVFPNCLIYLDTTIFIIVEGLSVGVAINKFVLFSAKAHHVKQGFVICSKSSHGAFGSWHKNLLGFIGHLNSRCALEFNNFIYHSESRLSLARY